MVVFVIVIVFVFAVGTSLNEILKRANRSSEFDVVVSWENGEKTEFITRKNLNEMGRSHQFAARFLERFLKEADRKKANPKAKVIGLEEFSQKGAVVTVIKASRAEKLGLIVTDQIIKDYLNNLGDGKISEVEIAEMVNEVGGEEQTARELFDWLRLAMLADAVNKLAMESEVSTLTPVETWEYFKMINRRVEIEAMPIAVANYKDKVEGEPTDAEIQKLFDEGKKTFPHPDSPTPGFATRPKKQFRYVTIDRKKILEIEKAKISAAAVKDHYEKNKDGLYVATELLTDPDDSKKTPAPKDVKKNKDPKPEDKSPKPAEKPPAKPPVEPKKDEKKKSSQLDLRSKQNASRSATTYFVNADEEKTADAEKGEVKEKAPEKDPPPAVAPPQKEAGKTPKKKKYIPLEKVEDDIRQLLAAPEVEKTVKQLKIKIHNVFNDAADKYKNWSDSQKRNKGAVTRDDDHEKPVITSYQKLVEHSEAEVARLANRFEMPTDKAKLESLVSKYKQADKKPELRKAQRILDAISLVELLGLAIPGEELPLLNVLEMNAKKQDGSFKYALAAVSQFNQREAIQNRRYVFDSFADIAFSNPAELYRPYDISSMQRDEFIYWTIQEQPQAEGVLKEVRSDVVAAWKLAKARELAVEEAKKKVAEANKSKKTLKEMLPDLKPGVVFETDAFSWLTPGGMTGELQLGQVANVDRPGEDFMKAVFDLREGESGFAFNGPKTIVYVFRIAKEVDSEDQLREKYFETPFDSAVQQLTGIRMRAREQRWQVQFFEEMKVKWSTPDQPEN